MPFYNIGIKVSQCNLDRKINFTNMLKLNLILASILSYISYLSQTFYFKYMNMSSNTFELHLIATSITTSSLLGSLNGFLIGSNDNKKLINFNIIYMISVLLTNKFILNYKLLDDKLIYTKNLPTLISCFYLLSKYWNYIDIKQFFSSKIIYINYGAELIVRNIITLLGLNINNYALFKLSENEIKIYEYMSGNINNYINIYSPLSIIIQKNTYDKKVINNICWAYILFSSITINLINYNYWNFNTIIINLYNILHFGVFINESKNISYNNITKSIKVLITIFVFKYILINLLNITTVNTYYMYINFVLFIKFLLNYLY